MMRCFELHRETDVSGVSGTGFVAEGVEFRDGTVVVRWLPSPKAEPTTVVHPNIANIQALHGHGGSTLIRWVPTGT
jgi:hypothetical protein